MEEIRGALWIENDRRHTGRAHKKDEEGSMEEATVW
jgi:hypothetical protein